MHYDILIIKGVLQIFLGVLGPAVLSFVGRVYLLLETSMDLSEFTSHT